MFTIYLSAEDGEYVLHKDIPTFEEAEKLALEWLGTRYDRVSRAHYVSMYGTVLEIVEQFEGEDE